MGATKDILCDNPEGIHGIRAAIILNQYVFAISVEGVDLSIKSVVMALSIKAT